MLGLYVILGIGCDDIFVLSDAFAQSAWAAPPAARATDLGRMRWAYRRAIGKPGAVEKGRPRLGRPGRPRTDLTALGTGPGLPRPGCWVAPTPRAREEPPDPPQAAPGRHEPPTRGARLRLRAHTP